MINIIISLFAIINIFLYASVLNAGELYYWTDKNGGIRITDTPPPQGTEHKETIKYKDIVLGNFNILNISSAK